MKRFFIELLRRCYWKICCLVYPIKEKILFCSFNGQQYSDNPRAISEKMHELYPQYEIVWYITKDVKYYDFIPDYIRVVKGRKLNFIKELASSCCFVTNTELRDGIFKRKGQIFVQTWHGDRAFKKILLDARKSDSNYVKDNSMTDLAISESLFGENLYHSAFDYYGDILKVGAPRNDILFKQDLDKGKILERLKLEKDCKILLFAPTFRDGNKNQDILVDLKKVLDILHKNDEKWVCLCRAHVNTSFEHINENGVKDVSDYPDMGDLLAICDFLISDYSSCATDFALLGRPIIMAVFDEVDYQANCRQMYVTPRDAGFVVASSQRELENILSSTTNEKYLESCNKVNQYYGVYSDLGNASELVCHRIKEIIKK